MKYLILLLLFITSCTDKKQITEPIIEEPKYDSNDIVKDPNLIDLSKFPQDNLERFTILEKAIKNNQLDIVKFGINKGFPVNFTNQGQALLHISANQGNIEIFDYLMSQGANINLEAGYEDTGYFHALSCSAFKDYKELIEYAFKHYSADITNIQYSQEQIYRATIKFQATNTLIYLIEELNYVLNEKDIYPAIITLNTNTLELLYNHGLSNINITNSQGETILEYLYYYIDNGMILDYTPEMVQETEEWIQQKTLL